MAIVLDAVLGYHDGNIVVHIPDIGRLSLL